MYKQGKSVFDRNFWFFMMIFFHDTLVSEVKSALH